jgi:hypothetical protein
MYTITVDTRQVYEMFTGIDLEDYEDYLPDDLIDATRYGDYGRVIDIIEHVTRPIGPNEPNAVSENDVCLSVLVFYVPVAGSGQCLCVRVFVRKCVCASFIYYMRRCCKRYLG